MTPIKSNLLKQITDSLKNQAFNGVYPVSHPDAAMIIFQVPLKLYSSGRLTG